MSEPAHAKLGPSGAHRWMSCPGSIVLEEDVPDRSSVYADEGTAAHILATWCLEGKTPAAEFLGETIRVGENAFTVTKDMAQHVQSYVDFVKVEAEGGTLLVEQRIPIDHLTGEEGAKGTADAVAIFTSGQLKVIDLKYGAGVKVDANANPQIMMYALGVLHAFDMMADFNEVSMYIHQPRMDHVGEYHLPVAELRAFGESVKAAASGVGDAIRLSTAVGIDQSDWESSFLEPGEKQCGFCRAKAVCPALRSQVSELISGGVASADDFAALVPEAVTPETGDNYLAVAMSKVGLVEDWCKSIRGEIERRLFEGKRVEGYKLVEGKQGNRAWADADKAEEAMKSMRLKQDEMYDRKIISPTAAEKLLKKSFPGKWERLQGHITRAPGKPSVAPASDPRPEMAITATAEDFASLV